MDELTEHAEQHCSHLTRDNFYWFQKMVETLVNQSGGVPSFYASRHCVYEAAGIPRVMVDLFDGKAFHEAMKRSANNAQTS